MNFSQTLSDALRRLLVVIGCVVLATAQPMSIFAATPAADTPRDPETVIYPKGSGGKTSDSSKLSQDSAFGGSYVLAVAILFAGAGAWVLWKRKTGAGLFTKVSPGKLQVEETKSLGNRQYLVVASYQGRKFLLGVTAERIEMLTHLSEGDDLHS